MSRQNKQAEDIAEWERPCLQCRKSQVQAPGMGQGMIYTHLRSLNILKVIYLSYFKNHFNILKVTKIIISGQLWWYTTLIPAEVSGFYEVKVSLVYTEVLAN